MAKLKITPVELIGKVKSKRKKKIKPKLIIETYTPTFNCLDVCIGFDCSSATVGWSATYIRDGKVLFVNYSYYKPEDKTEDPLGSIFKLHDYIVDIITGITEHAKGFAKNLLGIDAITKVHVCVEDFLLFMQGKSSARTITVLSVYNRTVCLAIYNALQIKPMLLPVATIRSSLRKLSRSVERIDKEHVPDTVEKIINDRWTAITPWKFRWLTNTKGNAIEECFDMGDGLAAGLAGAHKLKLILE